MNNSMNQKGIYNWSPLEGKSIRFERMLAIFLCLIGWIYLLPHLATSLDGTSTKADVKSRALSLGYSQVRSEVREEQFFDNSLKKITRSIAASKTTQELNNSLQSLNALKTYESLRRRSAVFGTSSVGNFLSDIWIIMYVGAIVLILILSPVRTAPYRVLSLDVLRCSIFIIVVFHTPNWMRNLNPLTPDRIVFSSNNFDISLAGFILQELRGYGWAILMSIVIVTSLDLTKSVSVYFSSLSGGEESVLDASRVVTQVTTRWVLSVLIVCIIFFPLTYFHWYEATIDGDRRYITHAVIDQLVWVGSLVFVSLPLIRADQCWQILRNNILKTSFRSTTEASHSKLVDFLTSHNPVGQAQVLLSIAVAVISLLAPVLQILK